MKKSKYLLMSLLAAATFTACSNDDEAAGSKQDAVDGFYMTMSFTNPQVNGTRTQQQTTTDPGTTEESKVTSGVVYLYDGNNLVFSKEVGGADWSGTNTTRPIKVSVNTVTAGKEYTVYFLANTTHTTPTTGEFTVSTTGGSEAAKDNQFWMFNQNDASVKGDMYKVTFAEENKSEANPAKVNGTGEAIKLDRVVARVDKPVSTPTVITEKEGETKTENTNAIKAITFTSYALSNLSNNAYVQQKWDASFANLQLPRRTFFQDYASFGSETEGMNLDHFGTAEKNYMFENTATDAKDATSIYFLYTAELTDEAGTNRDFTDGTFYRYDNKIYSSLQAIADDQTVANPFDGTTVEAALAELKKTEAGALGATEAELKAFREKYHMDVFEQGKVYYRYAIQDRFYKSETAYSVLRNSVYKVTVNNLFDLGSDVPNGGGSEDQPNYYLDVTVQVNPWVLNTIGVDLQ